MSRWQITIKDPIAVLPDLVLETFAEDPGRSIFQQTDPASFTATDSPIITGRLKKYRFAWEIAVSLSESDALLLEAFVITQDSRFNAQTDGRMVLIDEFEYCPPEPSPHSKTLLTPIATTYGMVYGFGQFNVQLRLPERHKTHQGVSTEVTASGVIQQKLIQFSAIEL